MDFFLATITYNISNQNFLIFGINDFPTMFPPILFPVIILDMKVGN